MSKRYIVKLENLISNLSIIQLAGEVERKDIVSISYDSRKVVKNSIFVAIKGFNFDGHNFIMEAIAKGATAIVLEDDSKISNDYLIHQNVTKILVKDSRKALALLSKNFFKNPSEKIKVIGVTGTNGKTSTTNFIKSILESAGYKTGLIGTVNNYIGDEIIPSEKTTPESLEFNKLLSLMIEKGCEYCVTEVSSHSLQLDRVYGIDFKAGVFTNLTQDHLDFHLNMENYFAAKKKLFDSLGDNSIAISNIDNEYGKRIVVETKSKVKFYGMSPESDFQIMNYQISFDEIKFRMKIREQIEEFTANVTGTFNVYNLSAAIATCVELGVDINSIRKSIKNLIRVPGRFEVIGNYPIKVIIDYAHTHDALQNVLNTIRDILRSNNSSNKVITVFGAGGNRDRTKRPKMGRVVEELSDVAIITADNPRNEELSQINNDILSGMNRNKEFFVIEDREDAIRKAISLANDGDIVLIAGKGHEPYQLVKNERIPFDDREVSRKILEERF